MGKTMTHVKVKNIAKVRELVLSLRDIRRILVSNLLLEVWSAYITGQGTLQ